MTYKEFKLYNQHTQIDIALEEGVIIGKRIACNDLLVLYQLEHFYAELCYLEDLSQIYDIHHFDSDKDLAPYLESIDISELVQSSSFGFS